MSSYIKKTYYEDDRYKISLEEQDGYLFIHLAIYKFSKGAYKEIKTYWDTIKRAAYLSGYDEIYTYSQEKRMFKLFPDAVMLGTFEKDNAVYEVWKWDLHSE